MKTLKHATKREARNCVLHLKAKRNCVSVSDGRDPIKLLILDLIPPLSLILPSYLNEEQHEPQHDTSYLDCDTPLSLISKPKDYYRILEVDYEAIEEEIRSNFIRLALMEGTFIGVSKFTGNEGLLVQSSLVLRRDDIAFEKKASKQPVTSFRWDRSPPTLTKWNAAPYNWIPVVTQPPPPPQTNL